MKKNSLKFIFISLLVLFLTGTSIAGDLKKKPEDKNPIFEYVKPGSSERDYDQNGIKDWWEMKHFGALLGSNINSDSDNDGFSDLIEYKFDSDPKNAEITPKSNTEIKYEYDSIGRIKKITRNVD
ncbi:MAG: hypothetical protein GY714_02805 [Desulfobacterales bacterium]|nr:hypothetical protein [Desulfobacterales bacterium]